MTPAEMIASLCGRHDTSPVTWDVGKGELPALFQALGYRCGAEVGVWKGGFSAKLCAGNPGLSLLCVDPWEPYADYLEAKNAPQALEAAYQEAQSRLKPYRCKFIRATSMDAAPSVPDGSLDFVYIDGNHGEEFVRQDLEAWTPKIRPGGILAGHDYRTVPTKPFIQVKVAVDTYVAEHEIAPWFLAARDRTPSFLWMIQ